MLEEGNRRDWFSDPLIVRLALVSAVSVATLLWWQFSSRNEHPVIDFRVLKNRQLAASIFLFVALGFGLYGGVFIFPLFTQSILRFTPTETGLTMLPGGLATGATALLCGRLLNGRMTGRLIRRHCQLDAESEGLLKSAMEDLALSARAYDRILRVARTIADLEGADAIRVGHLTEAIGYRSLDRKLWAR